LLSPPKKQPVLNRENGGVHCVVELDVRFSPPFPVEPFVSRQ
jgi:hypothetical protein